MWEGRLGIDSVFVVCLCGVCAVLLLDVSGSMSGSKLAAAKQSIVDLDAEVLLPGDTLTLYTFSNKVQVVMPQSKEVAVAGEMAGPRREGALPLYSSESLQGVLRGIVATGGTALYDATMQVRGEVEPTCSVVFSLPPSLFAVLGWQLRCGCDGLQ